MLYSIESIRDGMATLAGDDGSILCIPADTLPAARCGELLQRQPDGSFLVQPRPAARRAARALALFRRLKQSDPS